MRLSRTAPIGTLVVVAALALGACGDDDDDAAPSGDASVSTATIDGATVLVDGEGRALYTSDQESDGEVACTGGCAATWLPVAVDEGSVPAVDGAELDVTERPDGSSQLTLDGAPLYAFAEERAGELTGDGLADSFGGREFTWRAAIVEEAAGAADEGDEAESPTGGYGGY